MLSTIQGSLEDQAILASAFAENLGSGFTSSGLTFIGSTVSYAPSESPTEYPTSEPTSVDTIIIRRLQATDYAVFTFSVTVRQSALGGADSFASYEEVQSNFNDAAASGALVADIQSIAITYDNQDFVSVGGASYGTFSNFYTETQEYPTVRPTGPSIYPTPKPFQMATERPSRPTFAPTYQDAPVLSFVIGITLFGVSSSTLTYNDELAIQNATASVLQISSERVDFDDYVEVSRRRLINLQQESFNVYTNSTVTVNLIDYSTDADSLYSSFETSFSAAIDSGDFVNYLIVAAAAYGASATSTTTGSSYQFYAPFVVNVPSVEPSQAPSTHAPVSYDTQLRFSVQMVRTLRLYLLILKVF